MPQEEGFRLIKEIIKKKEKEKMDIITLRKHAEEISNAKVRYFEVLYTDCFLKKHLSFESTTSDRPQMKNPECKIIDFEETDREHFRSNTFTRLDGKGEYLK